MVRSVSIIKPVHLFAAFVMAAFLSCALATAPAYGVTAAEKEAEAQEALNQLYSLQDTLQQRSAQYYQSLAEYQDAVTLRDEAQGKIDKISSEITDIQGRLGNRARDMYRQGQLKFVDLLFDAASFDEFTKSWDILNRLNDSDAKMSLKAKELRAQAQEQKVEYDKQASIAEQKSEEANKAYKDSQKLVTQMEETYKNLSSEAQRLYEEEQAAAAAAAAAAAEAAAAEAAAAEQATLVAAQGETGDAGDAAATAVQNEDGTVTDTSTGQTYSSASEYSASTGNSIVDRARSMLGSTYRYGGTGSDGTFDCSGLVGYAITGTNERIGNTTTFMGYNQVSDPQPGDIVVSEGHTGIYIGDGQMIHAQDEEHGVVVGNVQSDMIYVRP